MAEKARLEAGMVGNRWRSLGASLAGRLIVKQIETSVPGENSLSQDHLKKKMCYRSGGKPRGRARSVTNYRANAGGQHYILPLGSGTSSVVPGTYRDATRDQAAIQSHAFVFLGAAFGKAH